MPLALLKPTHTSAHDELETFREIFENANIGIFQSTPEGRYIRVNPALAEMYGYTSADDMMSTLTDIRQQLYIEVGRREEFIEALLNDGEVENFESEVRRRDGKTIWISETARVVFGADGEVSYFEGFVKNVTQRIKLERQVAAFTQDLETRVQKRTSELQLEVERRRLAMASLKEALGKAEAATEAKSKFLASMSHELRTPLNAIIGFADAIKSEIAGPMHPAEYGEYIDIILSSGNHLLGLINDVLDLSKIDAGKVELSREEVSLSALVEECLELIGHRAREAGVDLVHVDTSSNKGVINADARRLKQVFLNLLSNAIKFTPESGRVTASVHSGDGGCLCVSVSDTGVGIAPDDIPTVLSEYGQVEHGLNHVGEGTGLGLPITKKLVELHGGKLTLESELGQGTTVNVCLPPNGDQTLGV